MINIFMERINKMNEIIFIDTGAFFSALDHNDTFHKKSIKIWSLLNESHLITSEFILIETATLIRMRIGIKESITFINKIEKNKEIEVIKINRDLSDNGWTYFKKFNDKTYSYVDCTSYSILKERNITKIFEFDEHFIQMGFSLINSNDIIN